VPSYWENPLTGKVEDPPAQTFEEWARVRPYHLADEISRAEEHLAELQASKERIIASGKWHGATFTSKLDRTDEMIAEAEQFIADLRDDADEKTLGLIASSLARRAELAGLMNNAYGRYLEGRV
jgi:hypothetical protein